jgi:hypothetical protein
MKVTGTKRLETPSAHDKMISQLAKNLCGVRNGYRARSKYSISLKTERVKEWGPALI